MMSNKLSAKLPAISLSRQDFLFWGGVILLLLWSAWDYGGRYLHIQTTSQVLAGGLILLLAARLQRSENALQVLDYPLLRPGLLWLLSLGLSFIFSVNRLASLEEIWRVVMYLLLGFGVYSWLRLQAQPQKILDWLLVICLAVGSCIAAVGWWMQQPGQALSSTFYRTNDLAGYLLLLAPIALHFLLQAAHWRGRLLAGLAFGFLSSSLFLTGSRTSWIACLLSLLCVLWWERKSLNLKAYGIIVAGVTGLALFTLALNSEAILPRLMSILNLQIFQENTTQWRWNLLQACLQIFQDHAWFGSGPNTFGGVVTAYMARAGHYSINPHNYYFQTLAETGLVGLGAFLLWVGLLIRHLAKQPNRRSLAVLAGCGASLIHIAFDIDWSVSAIPILFAVLIGLGLTPAQSVNQEHTGNRPALAGLLIFIALGLIGVPSLNYFSARAYSQAVQAEEAGQTEKALHQLNLAMQLAPWPSARHHYTLATLYQRQDPSQAIQAVEDAIYLDRYNARYYGLSSQLLIQQKRLQEAEATLLQRVELNPYRHPHIYTELADFYLYQLKEPQKAQKWFLKGQAAFPLEHLVQYEHYVPEDRFELFNLYMKFAALSQQLSQSELSENLQQQAQEIILHSGHDMFVQSGFGNPVAAVQAFWKEIPEHYRDSKHTFAMVHPQVQLQIPPPNRLDSNKIKFLQAERSLRDATLIYAVPFLQQPGRVVVFESRLLADIGGWKMVSHRPLQ